MQALRTALICATVLAVAAESAQAGMVVVNFTGEFSGVSARSDLRHYVRGGDTFTGSFSYDPDAMGTISPASGGIGTTASYPSAITDFSLTFTSGNLEGRSINGVHSVDGVYRGQMLMFDDVSLTGANNTSYIADISGGHLTLTQNEFLPGWISHGFDFRFYDRVDAASVDSSNLTGWDAAQAFANYELFDGDLRFKDVETGATQPVSFNFITFTSGAPPEPPPPPQEIPIDDTTTGPVEIFGGTTDAPAPGGLQVEFSTAPAENGSFIASYSQPTRTEFLDSFLDTSGFDLGHFVVTGEGDYQVWDLDFTGTLSDGAGVTLQFAYDDTGLTAADEANLGIWHYGKYGPDGTRQWKWLRDGIDMDGNVITVTVDNFSPFAAGLQSVPEPSSLVLLGMGALGLVGFGRRRAGRAVSSGI